MPAVSTPDNHILAYETWGSPDGTPVLCLHGNPGSRLRLPRDPDMWRSLGIRAITYDRPGYGDSTRRPGRSVADSVADVVAIADALGFDRFRLVGLSGGGPHALAVATAVPDRVSAAALVVPAAPVEPAEVDGLLAVNREAYRRSHEAGPEALAEQLIAMRTRILADPVAAIRAALSTGSMLPRGTWNEPHARSPRACGPAMRVGSTTRSRSRRTGASRSGRSIARCGCGMRTTIRPRRRRPCAAWPTASKPAASPRLLSVGSRSG